MACKHFPIGDGDDLRCLYCARPLVRQVKVELTAEQRGQVLRLRRQGWTAAGIAGTLRISVEAVRQAWM